MSFQKIGRKTYSLLVTRLYLIILIIMVIDMLINDQISSEKLNEGLLIAVVYLYLLEYFKLPYSYEFCKQNSNHW